MTAGGGRRPPGGPPRVPRSPESPPDAERPGQVISLDEIWHTEALFNTLTTSGTVPPGDPAAALLAAFLHDVDPSACPAQPGAHTRPERRLSRWPWPVPVRALVTGLVAAAAVVLMAVVQPPWSASGGRTSVRPLSAQLQPAIRVRIPGQQRRSPDNPPLAGPAVLVPPPAAISSPARSTPSSSTSIPAGARSGPASAARADQPGNAAPAGAAHDFGPGGSPPAGPGPGPVSNLSVPASPAPAPARPASPAAGRHTGPRRPPRTGTSPAGQHPHPSPTVPAPTSQPHRVTRPSPGGGATKPWQFWLRGTGRPTAVQSLGPL